MKKILTGIILLGVVVMSYIAIPQMETNGNEDNNGNECLSSAQQKAIEEGEDNVNESFSKTPLNEVEGIDETEEAIEIEGLKGLEIPVSKNELPEMVFERMGYTVSFNPETNIPNWVAWELNAEKLVELESRAGHFYPDPDIPRGIAVETKDYSNSGYDRGHMCPAADNKWDKQAMRESFYMTNICPQNHNLNRGDWKELEDDCRRWVEESGRIYIVCGPILYKNDDAYIGSERKIRVPDAFFKVVLAGMDDNNPRAIGFIYKNTSGDKPLDAYVNSIDEVEKITGFDFFSLLPDDIENAIEASHDLREWR